MPPARRRTCRAWPAAGILALLAAAPPRVGAGQEVASAPPPAAVSRPLGHVDAASAALLLSGQRGGALEGALACGVPAPAGVGLAVPLWVELAGGPLATSAPTGGVELQLVVYALADDGGVEGFHARTVTLAAGHRAALAASGLRIHVVVEAPRAAATLRVLVRERAGGSFFLDEARIPDGGAGAPRAWIPAAPGGWMTVAEPGPAAAAAATAASAPAARAVAAPGDVLRLLVTADAAAPPELRGLLREGTRVGVEAAEIEVVGAAAPAGDGGGLWEARWRVPELAPGPWALEVVIRTASGAETSSTLALVIVPSGAAGERPAWPAALAVARERAAAPGPPATAAAAPAEAPRGGGRDADRRAYREALRLLADGERDRAVAAVVELERGAVGAVRSRIAGFRGTSGTTERLVATEVDAVDALARVRPEALLAALDLHLATVAVWRRQADPLGLRHALGALVAVAQRAAALPPPRAGSGPPPAASAAAALAAAADAVLDLNAPADALELLRLADRLDPGHESAALGLAAVHEWFGRYREAVAALDDAAARPGALPELALRRAVNLRRLGRGRDAEAALRACLADGAPAWVRVVAAQELALALLDAGRPDESVAVLAGVPAASDPTTGLLRAFAAAAAGDRAAARAQLDTLERRRAEPASESPRLRYARWPAEAFAAERARLAAAARAALPGLAAALAGGGQEP